MKYYDTHRMVKGEDLNHHGTLFAGRMCEWMIESGFTTVANEYKHASNLVCVKVQEINFNYPLNKGDIINLSSKICYTGAKSITVYCKVDTSLDDRVFVDGFMTFVCVDDNKRPMVHNIIVDEPTVKEEIDIYDRAKKLKESIK
ncbi:MAG: acyl-CoA thioesterase [Peptostreptococcaceae bacterium]